jgi:uncharacterized protein (TIGR00730 family)
MENNRPTICVFCGSSHGSDAAYAEAARRFGTLIAERGYDLVFGGGTNGLMAEVSRAAFEGKAIVTSVIPDFLHKRLTPSEHFTREIVTASMHERKATMFAMADVFVALPGGIGTLEETVEMLTWAQLELHLKPVILINTAGYWNELLSLFQSMIKKGFADSRILFPLCVVSAPEEAINQIEGWLKPA